MTDRAREPTFKSLTNTRLVARNTVLNFLGMATPILVALFSIPLLIKGLGTDRFGVLTLAWLVIGYFGLFDMGLGRALTKLIAERLGTGDQALIPALFWTALILMFAMGLIGAAVVMSISPWLVQEVLKIPFELQTDTLHAFILLGISLPLITSTTGLWGVLEAYQRFGLTSAVRTFQGVVTYVGPLLVLLFSKSLFLIVAVLLAGRIIAWLTYLMLCFYTAPALRQRIALDKCEVWPLVTFGGWMTISNIISPIMIYSDRFMVGSLVSAAAVAYYVTPAEMVIKILVLPGAFVGVLFPAFAASYFADKERAALLFVRGIKYLFLILFPIILVAITLAHEALTFWLGSEFALNSTRVLQWLCVGIFVNSLAHFPSALLQGAGRPDISAKLHLLELPIYLAAVWWMTKTFGIEGTAVVWMVRAVADGIILFLFAGALLPTSSQSIKRLMLSLAVSFPAFLLVMLPYDLIIRGLACIIVFFVFVPIAWRVALSKQERMSILRLVSHSYLLLDKR